MKLGFLIFSIFSVVALSSTAFAQDDWEIFNCLPTKGQPNGFGIKSMKLEVSTEHPEANYTLVRKNKSVEKGLMDYEGSDSQFTVNGDEYTISFRQQKKNVWIAALTHESIDTISQLTCGKE